MSYVMKCFKSGNTLRVSLLKQFSYRLNARAGDFIRIEENPNGSFEITNLSAEQRLKLQRKNK